MQNYINQAENGLRINSKGFAVNDKNTKFKLFSFSRHKLGDDDILLEILYTGICHSDIHSARGEWKDGIYPMIPGHEILGRVVAIGKNVKKFKINDYAGVGCMINSCKECEACQKNLEQFCEKAIWTYNCIDCFHNDEPTYGGYSNNIVLNENFALNIPSNARLEKVAPLLCAGITTYSPLKFSKVGQNTEVGVAGFGGLGLMAVKYALKLGAKVSIFARNENKKELALKMGIKSFYTIDNLHKIKENFDFIISTIPNSYDPYDYIRLLKYGGEMAIVGLPPQDTTIKNDLTRLTYLANKKVYGSLIGGIKETQEMIDFSIKHDIYPEVELITASQIDQAYENLTNGKAKFRYVIDMKKSFD